MKLLKLLLIVFFLVASVTCKVISTVKPDGGVQYCNLCCDEKGNCWITNCW
jgi:hypothetical protein